MKPWLIVLLVVLVISVVVLFLLYRYGTKLQEKAETNQAEMRAGAQTQSLLVIDKKRMKLTEANLPKVVVDQVPKYQRRLKVPVVKVKIGPRILTMICDEKIFDIIPLKKEVKAVINGIYIIDVKGLRSGLDTKPVKKGFMQKLREKSEALMKEEKERKAKENTKKKK